MPCGTPVTPSQSPKVWADFNVLEFEINNDHTFRVFIPMPEPKKVIVSGMSEFTISTKQYYEIEKVIEEFVPPGKSWIQ